MYKAMKKKYVTPEAMDVEMALSPVMTAVSREQDSAGTGEGFANGPGLSAGNRGDWGNLWN